MKNKSFSIKLPLECEKALAMLSVKFVSEGFNVVRSFEIQSACSSFTEPTCPHSGNSPCDCQLVALLVCDQSGTSIPIMFHGHAGLTEVTVDVASGEPDLAFGNYVWAILQEECSFYVRLHNALQ